jgi:hypothetical protein
MLDTQDRPGFAGGDFRSGCASARCPLPTMTGPGPTGGGPQPGSTGTPACLRRHPRQILLLVPRRPNSCNQTPSHGSGCST